MSDLKVRNVISDAMHEAYRDDPNGADAQDILNALRVAGYDVVKLPSTEPGVDAWADQSGGVALRHHIDLVSVYTPEHAREIAAALLAAAAAVRG